MDPPDRNGAASSVRTDRTDREAGPREVRVRRIHRRDLNRAWEFLKLVFRDVNRERVE
jgi:hypothetical protein